MVRPDDKCGAERAQLEQKDEQLQKKDEKLEQQGEKLEQQGEQLEQKDEQLEQKDEQLKQKDEQLQQQGEQLSDARVKEVQLRAKVENGDARLMVLEPVAAASPRDRAHRKLARVQQRPRPALLEQQRTTAVAAPPPAPWRNAPAVRVDNAPGVGVDAPDCGVAPRPPNRPPSSVSSSSARPHVQMVPLHLHPSPPSSDTRPPPTAKTRKAHVNHP